MQLGAIGILCIAAAAPCQGNVPGATRWSPDGYVEHILGNAPIVISAGHGGSLEPASIPDRAYGTTTKDSRTIELAREFAADLTQRFGLRPHLILFHLHRRKVDVNRDIVEGAQGNPLGIAAYQAFHQAIVDARNQVAASWSAGFYFDLHGHGHPENWIELGYDLTSSELALPDNVLAQPGYVAQSTIRSAGNLPGVWFPELLRGATSLGGHLQSGGFDSVPSPVNPHPNGGNYFDGGFNVENYGSRNGGSIDGVQIEAPWSVRSSIPVRAPFLNRVGGWVDAFFRNVRGVDLAAGPRITLHAADRVASETGGTGELVLRRTGSTASIRSVVLQFDGSATPGADYVPPATIVTFGVGQDELRLPVRALDDPTAEGDEVARCSIVGGIDVGVPSRAEIVVRDDDGGADRALALPMDSLAAGSTPDASGNQRHAAAAPAAGGPTITTGRHGNALHFDGVDDRLRVTDFGYAPTGEFTLAFWFRTASTAGTGFRYLVSHGGVATPHRLGVYFDQGTGHLRTALIYANDLTTLDALDVSKDLRDGAWHHYALVARTDDLARVFIDGVPTVASQFQGDFLDPTGDFVIGARSDLAASTFADVALDDLALYDRALADVEVQLLHAPAPLEERVYPGTNEDLLLATGVQGPATHGPGQDVKPAPGGSTAVATFRSPGGTLVGSMTVLVAEAFATGHPPVHPTLPNVYLAAPIVVVGPVGLGPQGGTWTFAVPHGFAGISLMLQAGALSAAAANGLFAASDAHELRLR